MAQGVQSTTIRSVDAPCIPHMRSPHFSLLLPSTSRLLLLVTLTHMAAHKHARLCFQRRRADLCRLTQPAAPSATRALGHLWCSHQIAGSLRPRLRPYGTASWRHLHATWCRAQFIIRARIST